MKFVPLSPQSSESGGGLKKALVSQVVSEVRVDGSGSHATIYNSPDLFLGPFLYCISDLKGTEEVQCGILKRVCSASTLMRKVAHYLLA